MTVRIFDLETTIVERFKRKASPFISDNWVVAEGWKDLGVDERCSWRYMTEAESRGSFMKIEDHITVLVGHNIKFDLLWELARGNKDLEAFLKRGGRIWCTQYAEYLLQAQHPSWQMCSLNDVAVLYGGTTKIDAVKLMWEDGINTPDIPEDLLIDYLVGTEEEDRNGGDIGNTQLAYEGQIEKAEQLGMTQMIEERMDGLLATTFMEYTGLHVDTEFAKKYLAEKKAALKIADAELAKFIPELPPELTFNWNSNTHKSCLIFGGHVKYEKSLPYECEKSPDGWARFRTEEKWPLFDGVAIDVSKSKRYQKVRNLNGVDGYSWQYVDGVNKAVPQDTFKSGAKMGMPKFKNVKGWGKRKTRLTDLLFKFDGYTTPEKRWKGSMTDGNDDHIYSVGSDTMEVLETRTDVPFLKALAEQAALTKEIGTYLVTRGKDGKLKGMLTCVSPEDHIIHHKLNHTNTITTRLSSSDPNLQNLTRGDQRADGTWKSEVKKLFNSRWAVEDGVMVEIDYSQLEVVVQGVLTEDKQLLEDLNNRIDFHCKRVAQKQGCSYDEALLWCKDENHSNFSTWSRLRTSAKIFSFQRAYGAGAPTIANATGMTVEEVKELIAGEEIMYPGISKFYQGVTDAAEDSKEPIRAQRDDGSWGVFHRGYWQGPTGTRFTWRSYDTPKFLQDRGIMDQFAQPEILNYPTQGYGGEFVQAVLGWLIRWLIENDFFGGGMFDPHVILCNTVHDCVWFDCKTTELAEHIWPQAREIMTSIPERFNERYGMNITVPFPVDGEIGLNMNEMKHLH